MKISSKENKIVVMLISVQNLNKENNETRNCGGPKSSLSVMEIESI